MTGATGMVGATVLAQLLKSQREVDSFRCAVIARAKGSSTPEERLNNVLAPFERHWNLSLPRPVIFRGEVNEPGLGLSPADVGWVETHCDAILHSAASLSFSPASENKEGEPFRTNRFGFENVLRLADACGIADFHHVSTAYVCGKQIGRVDESAIDVGQSFANDYEKSKAQAESLAQEIWLRGRSDRTLTIYRPSIVVDTIGLTPVSGDRTLYGAFSVYQMLASRFGLPDDGEWFRDLGFRGDERKNVVDVHWVARAIHTILRHREHYGRTYHLTAEVGTSISELDDSFRTATESTLRDRKTPSVSLSRSDPDGRRAEIDQLAAPFVKTFLPYFRDDPEFDRRNIDQVIAETDLDPPPTIDSDSLQRMIANWSAPMNLPAVLPRSSVDPDEVVICGYEVRLPGGVDDARAFERLLYSGGSVIERLPEDRLDRSLYLHEVPRDPRKNLYGDRRLC